MVDSPDPHRRRGSTSAAPFALVVLPVFFVALSALRAWRIETAGGDYTGCHGCFWVATLGHDAWLLAALLALLAMSCVVRWRWLMGLLRIPAGLVLVVFALDMALDSLLSQRLFLGDILRLGKHVDADFSIVTAGLASLSGWYRIAMPILAMAIAVGLLFAGRPGVRTARVLALCAGVAGLFSAWALSRPIRYVGEVFTQNVVETNWPQGRLRTFSPEFIEAQRRIANAIPTSCSRSAHAFEGNVILVLVESLSSWHSRLLGSSSDWTPKLDAIARRNHYFTRFHANGFTTSGGEVALFTGQPPLIPHGSNFFTFDTWRGASDTLPDLARRAQREVRHFTSGNLSFLDEGAWLRTMGFDAISGHDDPFYSGRKRWQFDAAEDAALFDRVLDGLDRREKNRPYLWTLMTVSSHPPFVDPATGRVDPENTIRYVDAQIDRFYRELERRRFFDDGILLILGDHRTMTPLQQEEYAAFGERAFSRIPLIVAGAVDMPAVVDAPFQQTDIKPSLSWLYGLDTCTTPFNGIFLAAAPQPPTYILHSRGDDRDRIDVYWDDDAVSAFRLKGDNSHWKDTPPPRATDVSAWINAHRALEFPHAH